MLTYCNHVESETVKPWETISSTFLKLYETSVKLLFTFFELDLQLNRQATGHIH